MIATLPLEASVWHRFDVVDRARAEHPDVPVTHVVATPVAMQQACPMTIIAGFSSSRQGSAPLNLATQLARTTGEKIIAAAVVERVLPAGADPIEDEYRGYLASQATASLERVVDQMPGDLDISVIVHQSTSISNGLMELAAQHSADVVVVGSSSSGLLGRSRPR